MNNIVISETAEVLSVNNTTKKVFFCGLTTKASVTQKIKQDMVRGGFGSPVCAVLQSEKDIDFEVTTALHNDDVFAIQAGTDFTASAFSIHKTETVDMTVATTTGTLTVLGTPKAGSINVVSIDGKIATGATAVTKTITATFADAPTAGLATVSYVEDVADASVLDLKQDVFPVGQTTQLHSIAYDRKTNAVVADIYWVFGNCLPDGAISSTMESGKNTGDTVKFKALADDNGSMGKYAVIPRA
jgi:hypothetical protein